MLIRKNKDLMIILILMAFKRNSCYLILPLLKMHTKFLERTQDGHQPTLHLLKILWHQKMIQDKQAPQSLENELIVSMIEIKYRSETQTLNELPSRQIELIVYLNRN